MSPFTAQLYPGRALGFLVLGATLHDVLTRLKAEPQRFPKIELLYSPDRPVTEPVGVELPANGVRLRFDGPEQRLRLIEVTDFTKNHITFKERDLVKPMNGSSAPASPIPGDSTSGPTFRHDKGIYVLSYPGVAFNFSLNPSEYSPEKDVVSTFASASSQVATSMAIFSGDSWADARPTLWTEILPSIKSTTVIPRGKDLFRKWTSNSFWIDLGETTPQDLVMELGPPNAIYRKNDQKMVIHKMRTSSNTKARPDAADFSRPEELTDTDQSSLHDGSDASDNEEAVDDQIGLNTTGECFYNYFYLGFDVLISTRVPPSQSPPGKKAPENESRNGITSHSPDRLVATKLVLHGNIPGSYEFNRHRRCRWEIAYLDPSDDGSSPVNSETPFPRIEDRMNEAWASVYPRSDSQPRQRGMVLNRGWGDSPGSSCEFLGGWEESGARRAEANGDSTTTLLSANNRLLLPCVLCRPPSTPGMSTSKDKGKGKEKEAPQDITEEELNEFVSRLQVNLDELRERCNRIDDSMNEARELIKKLEVKRRKALTAKLNALIAEFSNQTSYGTHGSSILGPSSPPNNTGPPGQNGGGQGADD
ncbi:hypothetical protein NM208_g13232 [Fusarium decemcellulare]|uniref:Uncharacterized protein n=1 Tax=Fusarium decemcellulare TaxID=57161 RepID=A0ACC1RN91_9HYPO|nr:hypothetical protein NM208_g13232 [Fusarium decemcellulare]